MIVFECMTEFSSRDISLGTLLMCHRSIVLSSNPEDRLRIVVQRKHIFEDTLHRLRNGIDVSKHLRVTFIGEPAINDGGPMREYMRLLLGSIVSNNSSFCGDINSRLLRHNVIELNKKTYFHVGQILSITLVHGGPAPSFFAEPIADYILHGLEKVKVSIADVQDKMIKRKLQKGTDLIGIVMWSTNLVIIICLMIICLNINTCKYSFRMLKTLNIFDSCLTPMNLISGEYTRLYN